MPPVSVTVKERDFYDELDESSGENTEAPLAYHVHIELDSNPKQALKAVQAVIYSDASRIPEPYTLAETNRIIERGATGSEYEIIIAVMSGLAANIGAELIKGLAGKISKRHTLKEDKARARALSYLTSAAELPKRSFELLYGKDEDKHFAFMFREKLTDKKYYISISKELAVIEYQIYGPGIIPEEDA